MRLFSCFLFFFFFCLNLSFGIFHKNSRSAYAQDPASPPGNLLWQIGFDQLTGDTRKAVTKLGFRLEKDMEDEDEIELTAGEAGLQVKVLEPSFGLMVKKDLAVNDVESVEITWAVHEYPHGADWGKQLNREAILVYFFFGEPVDADHFYLPDSPYFIGLFLGEKEDPSTPYIGKNYTETGRYFCVDNPPPGEMITSRFAIGEAYRKLFKTEEVPPLTGIAIEADTSDLPTGRSSASIRQITVLGNEKS